MEIPMMPPLREAFSKHSKLKNSTFGNIEPSNMSNFGFPFSSRKFTKANDYTSTLDSDRQWNLKNYFLKDKAPGPTALTQSIQHQMVNL
jgi:hypothetical protein